MIVHYVPSKKSRHPVQPRVNYGRAMRGIATELRTAATTLDLAWKAATEAEACGHLEATIDALEDKLSELRSVRIMREEDR